MIVEEANVFPNKELFLLLNFYTKQTHEVPFYFYICKIKVLKG